MKNIFQTRNPGRVACTLIAISLLLPGTNQANDETDPTLAKQRAAFREVYPSAASGVWSPVQKNSELLHGYILWPDLRGAYLKARIDRADREEIRSYLNRYGDLRPGRELRYRYLLQLSKTGQNSEFLQLYDKYYQEQQIAQLDCLALQARIKQGQTKDLLKSAEPLWLVGKSQHSACDPVFAYLKKTGQLNADLYRQRYDIAITSRNFSLARYLAKSLDSRRRNEVEAWAKVRKNPESFVSAAKGKADSATTRAQLIYALERLSYRQPARAASLWEDIRTQYDFKPEQQAYISRHTALWAARRQSPVARVLLDQLPADAVDEEVRRWQLRNSLSRHDWQEVITRIEALPKEERGDESWRYWRAIAQQQSGLEDAALKALRKLAKERSYYGFLAADALQLEYNYANRNIEHNEAILSQLRESELLLRARELYRVGQDGRGRSEWQAAVSELDTKKQEQAAILAHQWGWHSRAIATAASSGQLDDLDIRYPLPFRANFKRHAKNAKIEDSWAYGIARSESLFMRDIRSSAGAIGLMQLMPATGKSTAKSIRMPYSGLNTLITPNSNIQLGTTYLGQMHRRFGNNPVLATAAYNAGPGNVSSWLPDDGKIDARIWVENIPFNETRKYVRRVLEAGAIFHWRMTGQQKRLSSELDQKIVAVEPKRKQVAHKSS